MMSAKGSGSITPVQGEVDRMRATGRWDIQRLFTATLKYDRDPRFPTALGLACAEQDNWEGSVHSLREARRRLVVQANLDPNNQTILDELRLVEADLAEAEEALAT